MARVQILEEVCDDAAPNEWSLCFQFCRYIYAKNEFDVPMQEGYRFIWRTPNTRKLQAARGQARLPSIEDAQILMDKAIKAGWGQYKR